MCLTLCHGQLVAALVFRKIGGNVVGKHFTLSNYPGTTFTIYGVFEAFPWGSSFHGIGWIVGPLVGGQLLFSGVNIAIPYALVGIFVLAVALVLSRIKLVSM